MHGARTIAVLTMSEGMSCLEEGLVEFVDIAEVRSELKARGVVESPNADGGFALAMEEGRVPVVVELSPTSMAPGSSDSGVEGRNHTVPCPNEHLAPTLETILHKLHLAPLHIFPRGTWRPILDRVSFGLASNEAWQEIDSQASLEQNTRDPLACGPRDLHTLRDLVRTLLDDGEADAGASIAIVAAGQRLIAHVEPNRPIRIEIASAQVATQVRDAALHYLQGVAGGSASRAPE
jgi:hypothetical protein